MGTLKIVQICLVVFQVFPLEFCVDFTLRASNESQFKQFIGVINLESDFRICKEGDTLTPEQARLLVRNLLILKLTYNVCTVLNRPFSKMATENLNKSKLKTNTSARRSTLTLVTLPSFSISGEISGKKM